MVSYCCVKGCGNKSKNKKTDPNSVISFHAFPSNQEQKSKWLRAIGRPNWVPPNHSRVCSAHFNYDQINYDGCRIRVKDEACPVNSLPPNSNFEASDVEACRICLATDVKMYSLQNTHLGTCIESVAGFSQNHNIDGLPQYICYQCAPCLVQCNQLIEKCMISQATLLDIFVKNGQITKHLIKELNRANMDLKQPPLNNSSLFNDVLFKYNDVNNTLHCSLSNSDYESNDEVNYENAYEYIKIETETTDLETKNRENRANENYLEANGNELEATENELEEINIAIGNEDNVPQVKHEVDVAHVEQIETTLVRKKANTLTPDEKNMLKYFNIVELSLHEQIEEWEKNTVRRPLTSETVYQCEICSKTFANMRSYRVHVTYHDPSLGQAECPVCKLRFKTSALATSHARRAHAKKFFCKMCPEAFNNVGVAKRHQKWHSGYLYKCHGCSFSTLHESSLNVHRRRAHGSVHACSACGRAYISARGLRVHSLTAHRMEKDTKITKDHRCEECAIDFISEGARRVHILTSSQHRNKLDLGDTNTQASLRNSCNKCGVECSSYKELVLHTRVKHPRSRHRKWPGDTTYPRSCELCGETLSSRKYHWQHVRRQHPRNIDSYQPVITAVCDICGKGFQNTTKLRLHQLRHRSPAVRCPKCSRLFYDKYALARHARSHDEHKPHQCRTCGRTFKLLNNLERHKRVHTNIAPYECTMCGKKFKYSSSVNLHVRTVHYKLPHPPRRKRSKIAKDASDS